MTEHGPGVPPPGGPQWAPPGQVPAQQYAYPGGGAPGPYAVAPPPPVLPRPDVRSGPVHVEPVPGTEFGLAIASVPPTFSGQAIGSLVAGIASIVVSLVVGCFGIAGGGEDWGVLVSGAFAILAGLLGLAGVGLGLVAVRLVKASRGRITGRGVAVSGIVCGGSGVVLTAGGMLLALVTLVSVSS